MMNRSIFSRSLLIFFLYTLVLIGVLYLVQRYLAPSLYYDSIIDDYSEITNTLITRFEEDSLTSEDYLNYDLNISPSLYVYSNQGEGIYPLNAGSLTAFQTVDIFRNAPIDRLIEDEDGFFIETFETSGDTIFHLRSSVDPYITNFNTLNRLFLILFISALILMIPLSYFFAKSFSRPIVKLNHLATKLSELDFDFKEGLNRNDELGTLEQTLKSMAYSLKETIEELKVELEKEKALEKLQKQFVARVSHEIRTPLSIIKVSVESLLSQIKQPLTLDFETMINEEIDHLVHLTDDLLDLAQLESGRFNVQKETFDLKPLIDKVVKTHSLKYKRSIINEIKDSLIVKADPKRLMQVFNNLISNAFMHSDIEGEIQISNREDVVIIKNPKKPLKEEELVHLKESFYKLKENKEGYGLGLSITQAILSKHDIAMKLDSKEDLFIVTLDITNIIN